MRDHDRVPRDDRSMRLKLVESRLTIERQEKLASLGVLAACVAHEQ
jgi:hypothetical protein